MKLRSAILGAVLLVVGAGAANAQGSNWLGVNVGSGFPSGDYGDAASMGWNAGVTGTHMVNTNWGFGGDVNYHSWNGSEDANTAAELAFGPGSEYSWSAVQATAHGVYRFPTNSNVRPYAKFGTGIYNVKLALDSPSGDAEASESNLGFNFGGGMNFATSSNMMWGVNAAYHLIQADGGDINEFSLGMNLLWGVGGR